MSDANNIFIFTDASSYNNGRKNRNDIMAACASIVVKTLDGNVMTTQSRVLKDSTNNRGEAYALLMGLRFAENYKNDNPDSKITIISDSKLCVMSITKWAYNWERNTYDGTWRNSSDDPVINQDILKNAFSIYTNNRNIKIVHIRGHIINKAKRDKAINTFIKLNGYTPSDNEFEFYKKGNDSVDKVAVLTLKEVLPKLYRKPLKRERR